MALPTGTRVFSKTSAFDRRDPEAALNLTPPADAKAFVPTSVLLQRLHDEAPTDHFTLGWVMRNLHKRGFGLILLLLSLVAIAPGVSIVAGLLL